MTVPAMPDRGKDWLNWATGIDGEARKVAAKVDTAAASAAYEAGASATVYVASSGSDANQGLISSKPKATIAAAITALAAAGGGVVQILTDIALGSTGVTVPSGVDLWCVGDAEITYAGTGVAVLFDAQQRGHSRVRVNRTALDWTTTDDTSVGVQIRNSYWNTYEIVEVQFFATGVDVVGDATDCSMNTLLLNRLNSNKRGLRGSGINGGSANQQTVVGGVVRISTGGTAIAGARYVDLRNREPGLGGNAWTFIGVNLEGAAPEFTAEVDTGSNTFVNCRWESATGVKFGSVSADNQIIFGYNVHSLPVTDSSGNNVKMTSTNGRVYVKRFGTTADVIADGAVRCNAGLASQVTIGHLPDGSIGAGINFNNDTGIERIAAGQIGFRDAVFIPFKSLTAGRKSASAAGQGAMAYDVDLAIPIWSDGTNWKNAAGTVV